MAEEFFTNRELYDLIQQVANEMVELKTEMKETRAIIRDYNNLRKKLNNVEEKAERVDTRLNTLIWVVGVSIPTLGLLFTILNYLS